jgi:hypothetical protein
VQNLLLSLRCVFCFDFEVCVLLSLPCLYRKPKTDTKAESKSASLVRPKPRYAKPGVPVNESVDPAGSVNLNSSRAIRDVVFMAWEQQKLKKIKADLEAKRKLEKEAEDKKKQVLLY